MPFRGPVLLGALAEAQLEFGDMQIFHRVEVTGNRSAGRQDVAEAIGLIQNGRIKPIVGKIFPLQDAARAHEAFEKREIVGRAVLMV